MVHKSFGFKGTCFIHRWIFRWANIIIVGIALVLLGMPGCAPRIPKEVKEVIFEKSEFAVPITLKLPCEDRPECISAIEKLFESGLIGFLPKGCSILLERKRHNEMLKVLAKHGFATIKVKKSSSLIQAEYVILTSYSEKIKPYIYKEEIEPRSGLCYTHIKLASRVLKSIDYKNKFKESLSGTQMFAVTFSYTLKKEFPIFKEVINTPSFLCIYCGETSVQGKDLILEKSYKGKAVAYLDPTDGKWKLGEIKLEEMTLE